MMNNNKILTVSYGTFSCTLEGFDDSFDTMKAIAEYFRDLAADDRYFGAEPPQPDAEMLARIAEREVSRRVEAREHEGQILLKAHEESTDIAAPPAVEPAQTPQPAQDELTDEPVAASIDVASEPAMRETVEVEEEPSEPASVKAKAESAEEAAPGTTEQSAPETHDVPAEDIAEEPVEEAPAEQAEAQTQTAADFFAQSDGAESVPSYTEEPISAADFTASTLQGDTDDLAEDVGAAPAASHVDTESFADKLARIRAVVATQSDDATAVRYEEDSEAPDTLRSDAGLDAAFADAPETDAPDAVVAEAAQDISEALDADAVAETQIAAEEMEHDELDNILKNIEQNTEEDATELTSFDEDDDKNDNVFEESQTAEATLDDTETSETPAVQGRIMKVDRSSLEAALASGELEAFEDDELSENAFLDADDEADLQRNLASAEADADEAEASSTERQSLPDIGEDGEKDVSRLMAEADAQMKEPEGKTRRSAFAHLRAAVAARFADRSMDYDAVSEEEASSQAYKSDLAEVVKPRRPQHSEPRTERPADGSASPLKLVAEQRISDEDDTEQSPVAPRRIAATDDTIESGEGSDFAEYARERGATALPEVLEAAAAYLSFVEGHEQFSRPQLMTRVREADCGNFSREDGLRSFGQLLRAGKIEKIKGGRFCASDGIGYKPEHRAAG